MRALADLVRHGRASLLWAALLCLTFAAQFEPLLAWCAAALTWALVSFGVSRRGLVQTAAAGGGALLLVFYAGPSLRRAWHHDAHHAPGTVLFFAALLSFALLLARMSPQLASSRAAMCERVLLYTALLTWLVSFFGVYFYSLARLAPAVLLAGTLLSAIGARRLSALRSVPLLLFGLAPLAVYKAESYNVDFTLLRALDASPVGMKAIVFSCALGLLAPQREAGRRLVVHVGLLCAWAGACLGLFEFDSGQVFGFLCGAIALKALLALVRDAALHPAWASLAVATCLLLISWVAFHGFALSRIDFRFATGWVVPFRAEALRAPQLVLYAWVKYAWAWLPAVLVARRQLRQFPDLPAELTQLVAWRLIAVVLASLGLRLFDAQGVHELCAEEIYYWAWFALASWLFALGTERWKQRRPA